MAAPMVKNFGDAIGGLANIASGIATSKAIRGGKGGFDIASGILSENTKLALGDNTVSHNLGRVALGCLVLSATPEALVVATASSQGRITVNASDDCVANLYII